MSETTSYCNCGAPTRGTTLCHKCTKLLTQYLAEMPGLIADLRTAITRQTRFSKGLGIGKSTETPVMFNTRAAEHLTDLAKTIPFWQARMADHYGIPVRYPNTITATAWMLTAITLRGIATFIDAGQMYDALQKAHETTETLIDRPADKWYAGICSAGNSDDTACQQELYATTDKGDITCPKCAFTHDIQTRRNTLLKHAADVLATATEAARAIVVWSDYERGENLLVKRIGMWAERGRITPKGTRTISGKQRPTYRIGDILNILEESEHARVAS